MIFFHPDGMSLSHWDIGRIISVGPDGLSPWDKMPHQAVYKSHLKKHLVATSQAGATIHAYGVKVGPDSFGTDEGKKLKQLSLLKLAQKKGFKTGLCQTGFLAEPGTAVFASTAQSRKDFPYITEQLIDSDVTILLGGGEKHFLPEGVKGRFGFGTRQDNKNLIKIAQDKGYYVIYTLKELQNIPQTAKKVLGIFAYKNTYNDEPEEVLKLKGLKPYNKSAPSIAQMSQYALEFLTRDKDKNFFLIAEEEGTDNFSNKNNAEGLFMAIKRSLKAITLFRKFVKTHPNTLFITASDSNASSPVLIDHFRSLKRFHLNKKIPKRSDNSAPLDRQAGGLPFASAPNKQGVRMPFAIIWPTKADTGTGILIKAEGLNAGKIQGVLDNTDVHQIMKQTLLGL